jgi:hypothetical protein
VLHAQSIPQPLVLQLQFIPQRSSKLHAQLIPHPSVLQAQSAPHPSRLQKQSMLQYDFEDDELEELDDELDESSGI